MIESKEVVLECSTDICSSIPGLLNFNPDPNAERQPLRIFNVSLLLWPLYNAGLSDLVPKEQLEWIIGRLRFISEVMTIRQATPLMSNLMTKVNIPSWDGESALSVPAIEKALVAMDAQRVAALKEVEKRDATQRQAMMHENMVPQRREGIYTVPEYVQPTIENSPYSELTLHGTPQMTSIYGSQDGQLASCY
jgi:hypothetical protein